MEVVATDGGAITAMDTVAVLVVSATAVATRFTVMFAATEAGAL
jgi:hypothetical protein